MFPNIIQVRGKRFAFRSSIERYKVALAGIPFQKDTHARPDVLVPIKTFATEMGVCVRTIERWSQGARSVAIATEVAPPAVEERSK
jgi:hypothetical protein